MILFSPSFLPQKLRGKNGILSLSLSQSLSEYLPFTYNFRQKNQFLSCLSDKFDGKFKIIHVFWMFNLKIK